VGGSPSETSSVVESLAYNNRVLSEIQNSYWHPEDFRMENSERLRAQDSRPFRGRDGELLRAAQTIAIAKFSTVRDRQALIDDLFSILKRMHWSDGYVVDRSFDRVLVRKPLTYEYKLDVDDYSVTRIQPVGESFRCQEITRMDET
jgi:hypothetical protein